MIIGNGNIAKVLEDRDDVVFFTSGVSNGLCTDEKEFERERKLLKTVPTNEHIVYFSNLGIYYKKDYKKDPYTKHKIYMEEYIRNHYKSYTIVRIEVCEWVKTPTTILNVFKKQLSQGIEPNIKDATRYVLSLTEFKYWVGLIESGVRNEMNILGRKLTISQLLNEIKQNKI
jgi:UDP-2-acetamido-2,6-beta-L-arabino-hexul-4-ose reductase